MLKLKSLGVVIALSIAMLPGIAGTAFAAKKHLTYDEAYKRCKVHVDKLESSAHQQRYSRGSACMHAYGYKL